MYIDISADRTVWLQPALRSFAIVCDYMETALFAIVCDLRFAIRDRLQSSAIIWKPALIEPKRESVVYAEKNSSAPEILKLRSRMLSRRLKK